MVPDECVLRNMDSRDSNSTDEPKVDSGLNVERERAPQPDNVDVDQPTSPRPVGDSAHSSANLSDCNSSAPGDSDAAAAASLQLANSSDGNKGDDSNVLDKTLAQECGPEADKTNKLPSLDEASDVSCLNNLTKSKVVDSNSATEDSPNVVLRIPQARLVTNSENTYPPNKHDSVQNGPDSCPDSNLVDESKISVNSNTTAADAAQEEPKSGLSSRRTSYIDVVGLSADEQSAEAVPASERLVSPHNDQPGNEESEDKDFSEDEDKLVIHEGSSDRKPEEEEEEKKVFTVEAVKRPSDTSAEGADDNQQPKKKARHEEGQPQVINLTSEPRKESRGGAGQPGLDTVTSGAQVDVLLAQVNRDIELLEKQLQVKEEEWNAVLRSLKEKEEMALRLRRKGNVLRFQTGSGDLPSTNTFVGGSRGAKDGAGGGLLAALTSGAATLTSHANSYDSSNPIAMMSRLLTNSVRPTNNSASLNETQGNSRSNTSSPSVSIIDIHTRTASPVVSMPPDIVSSLSNSITNSHSTNRFSNANLPENLKNKLTRQLLNAAGSIKPILPKPQHQAGGSSSSNGSPLLSSLAGQNPAPQTLAGMLSAGPNGSLLASGGRDGSAAGNTGLLSGSGGLQATGYGPQGPTISVQQLIAAHRKDNPSTPPVRGAKRGAWRQKYDNGGGKRGSGRGGDASGDRSSSLALSDPTVSYNDVLLQFAQLTQQQQNAEKNGPGSPQISIIPVSDSSSGGGGPSSSQYGGSGGGHPASASGGLSVTATSSKHSSSSSSMLEGTSALAKLLMESRSNTKQNALLEHQQQQQQVGGNSVGNSQYLTLSALLSGGTTTTVREKAAAAAAAAAAANAMSHHQSGDSRSKKSESGLGDPSAPNPKCQGCHKERAQFVCAGCGNQWYCSRDCQVAAWDEHSERCNT